VGLYDKKGRGRKRKLNPDQREKVREWAKAFPKNLHKVCALITENFGISVSKKTIKRVLKAFHFSWRRIRQRVKGKPDPKEYEEKEKELENLQHQDERGEIDLRYFDESGFCLTPYVPYAWQEKGEQIEVETSKSRRLNVLGFMNRRDGLDAYTIEGSVDSNVVIAIMDEFSKHLTKKTVVVIDNAPMHTSEAFQSKLGEWAEKRLEFFALPPYSPQLNIIEILWRFMKYEWIDFKAYTTWENLLAYVEEIIINYGKKYIINFG
jgi:transposase